MNVEAHKRATHEIMRDTRTQGDAKNTGECQLITPVRVRY